MQQQNLLFMLILNTQNLLNLKFPSKAVSKWHSYNFYEKKLNSTGWNFNEDHKIISDVSENPENTIYKTWNLLLFQRRMTMHATFF